MRKTLLFVKHFIMKRCQYLNNKERIFIAEKIIDKNNSAEFVALTKIPSFDCDGDKKCSHERIPG